MNREAQQYLGDNPTDEQISNVHNMLEALRWICPRWLAELSSGGTDENEGSQYSHVLDEDKRALAALLRKYIGASWAALTTPQRRQALQKQAGRRLENPATRVARVAGATADTAADNDTQEDNLDDDEDEFGAEDGSPPPPAGGGADMQPDPTRATRDEAWDQHIAPILQRCPKQ